VRLAVKSLSDARAELFHIQDEIRYARGRESAQIERRAKQAATEAHYRQEQADIIWRDMCALFDLPITAGRFEVREKFNRIRKQMSIDPVLDSVRNTLNTMQNALDRAKKELEQ